MSTSTLYVSDLSFWRLRGFCVPSGRRSPGGAGRWWSCWLRRSSWCLQNCSCWRRCSCSPLPVAGQAAEVEQMKDRRRHMTGFKLMTGYMQSSWPGSLVLRIEYNDVVLHGHFEPSRSPLNVNRHCGGEKQLFIYPDVGSVLHVTARRIKIVPSPHVHPVLISCTS